MRRLAAVVGLALASLPVAPALADIGPFRGAGTGLVDRFHRMDRPEENFFSNSKDVYTGRFVYSFNVDQNGNVRGRGHGVYNSATWHLDGNNGDKGAFGCDIPIETVSNYDVAISGRAVDGEARPRFELVGAEENNDDYDCGAEYTGYATRSTYLPDSLILAQADDPVSVDLFRPRIGALRLLEQLGDARDSRVNLHEWHIGIRAPDTRQDAGPNAPPGRQTRPPRGGGGGGGFPICTIEGTARGERLTGTTGNDIICAYGGNDRINGRGGHDLVYAGPGDDRATGGRGLDTLYGNDGRDSLATRDGKKDKAHGGAGTDSASVDGRDTTVSVERVSRR